MVGEPNIQEIERENIKQGLKIFMRNMKEVEDYNEILNFIFDYHLANDKNGFGLPGIIDHIATVFMVDPHLLFKYLVYNGTIALEELNVETPKFRNAYNGISKLKLKYGVILRDLINRDQDPFLIKGADINVRNNESTHKMRIYRNDGESLSLNFKPGSLMPVNFILTQALIQSIKQGIFNLDEGMIQNYITTNEEINKILNDLLRGRKTNE